MLLDRKDEPVSVTYFWPVLVAVMVGIIALFMEWVAIKDGLRETETAASDKIVWTISQLETDSVKFERAVHRATHYNQVDPQDLEAIRLSYDVLFARLRSVEAQIEKGLVLLPEDVKQEWATLIVMINALAPLIDSEDRTLASELDQLANAGGQILSPARELVVKTMLHVTEADQKRRTRLAATLYGFSLLAAAEISLLILSATAMVVLYRRQRRRAVAERRTGALFQKTIEGAQDAVMVTDSYGRIIEINAAAESIFGYSREALLGQDMAELLIPTRMREAHRTGMKRYLETGKGKVADKGRIELQALHANGQEIPVEVVVVSEHDTDGAPIFIGFVRDITERLAVEAELRHARDEALSSTQAKSRFLAVMSHEMRTPLNGIIQSLDLLKHTTLLSDKQTQFIEVARNCSVSALEQVDDVLDLTRLSENDLPEQEVAFDPIQIVRDLIEQITPMAQSRNNRLHLELTGPEPGVLVGSRRLFLRVLSNLVSNALKFTQDGDITLRVRSVPYTTLDYCHLCLEVEDTGVGIPSDKLGRVFDMFETFDTEYNYAAGGTGLGLFIAKRAMDKLGGSISVESQVGKGSIFRLELTLSKLRIALTSSSSAHTALTPEVALTKPMRVLVAEDNSINRLVLKEMLSHMGHKVEEAQDGAIAVEKALSIEFDLVLMDISMPEVDGLEAARRIRKHTGGKTPRIVALTAHALPEDLRNFHQAGLEEVAIKPLSYAELAQLICKNETHFFSTGESAQVFLNEETLDELRRVMSPDRFGEVVLEFLEEGSAFVEVLKNDPGTNEERFLSVVHRFSGACGVFGAERMHAVLSSCEEYVKSNLMEKCNTLNVECILENWRKTEQALRSYLVCSGGPGTIV